MKMNTAALLSLDNWSGCPFTFFNDGKKLYKIYNDGENYVATLAIRPSERFARTVRKLKKRLSGGVQTQSDGHDSRQDIDILFDSLYFQAVKDGMNFKGKKNQTAMIDFIRAGVLRLFPDFENLDEWILEKIKRKLNNLQHRKKRFRRKAYLNPWNYFVTFTYDDKKQSEETFRKKLRKCLSNLHTRRGWNYMGVFEYAPETGRLHFHGLLYVPDDQMIGEVREKRDWSTAQNKMQITHENSFFEETFGRNDFEEISEMELKSGKSINYILKYIGKTGERICYSRGIPAELYKRLGSNDIITEFTDFGTKYVLFNRSVEKTNDKCKPKRYRQMRLFVGNSGHFVLIS